MQFIFFFYDTFDYLIDLNELKGENVFLTDIFYVFGI